MKYAAATGVGTGLAIREMQARNVRTERKGLGTGPRRLRRSVTPRPAHALLSLTRIHRDQ